MKITGTGAIYVENEKPMVLERLGNFEIERADDCIPNLQLADSLLKQGMKDPAAVIAGSLLEHHLRRLCSTHEISLPDKPKLDQMNALLASQNVHSKPEQKQITAWAGIRNYAAHGNYQQYDAEQVRQMIAGIRHYIASSSASESREGKT
jgi:hypothetical protein